MDKGTKSCLYDLQNLVAELNSSNSTNDKKEVLARYPQCKEILYYVYNPFYQFNVTSKNLKKNHKLYQESGSETIFDLLDKLSNREITGNEAVARTNGFIKDNFQYEELIYNIIDKNLKTRTGASIINKVYPDLIPEFKVALANTYSDYKNKVNFKKDIWYASRKLDGVRCITVIENTGEVHCYSRKGKEFETLDKLKDAIDILNFRGMVLDGEICIVDEGGNEDFQSIMKEIRRKDHTIQNPKYKVFDVLTEEDFLNKESEENLSTRLSGLDMFFEGVDCMDLVEQTRVESEEHLMQMMNHAISEGWEGLILRKNTTYKGKRSNDLLKVKQMHDDEYQVLDTVNGKIRHIVEGVDIEEEMLSSIVIEHRGNKVEVGSGFSMEQRQQFYTYPEEIVGKIVTIRYFEETQNKEGEYSLRFPVLKHIHGEEREV